MTTKKMKIEDLKQPAVSDTEAIAHAKESQNKAVERLEAMHSEYEFAMTGECLDKQGNKTKVLIINTDKEGYIGMFLEIGNPYAFDEKGKFVEDSAKLVRFINFMSNIDLTDSKNQKAIGIKAIGKARSTAENFFMLNLVSAVDVDAATAG